MQNVRAIVMAQVCRHMFTSSVTRRSTSKQGRIIEKIIRKDQSKRGRYYPIGELSFTGAPKKELSLHTRRRITVLNKIFMQHITDMMSTGDVAADLLDKNIEISKVEITADFKFLNIHWIDSNNVVSDIEELLKKCAKQLRLRLIELRVMGYVPPIQFVKCRHVNTLKEIERRLMIADYGEDYIPSVYQHSENCIVTHNNSIHDSSDTLEDDDTFEITLPVMKHDVLGLDHARIMSKIKSSLNQSRQTLQKRKENSESVSVPVTKSNVQNVPEFLTPAEQKAQFSEFLAERRRDKKRMQKLSQEENIIYDLNEDDFNIDDEITHDFSDEDQDEDEY